MISISGGTYKKNDRFYPVRKIRIIHLIVTTLFLIFIFHQNVTAQIMDQLNQQGFRNIKFGHKNNTYTLAVENKNFRNDVDALRAAMNCLSSHLTNSDTINIVLLERGLGRVFISKLGNDSNSLRIKPVSSEIANTIAQLDSKKKKWGGIDLVLWPNISVSNFLLHRLYEVDVSISPTIFLSLWKGALFTGQMTIPVYVDPIFNTDFTRIGIVTLSQQFRFGNGFIGDFTFGNFNSYRYGVDLTWRKDQISKNVSALLNIGYTGKYNYIDDTIQFDKIEQITGAATLTTYIRNYNIRIDNTYMYNTMREHVFRCDFTQYFGNVAIGLFAAIVGKTETGGFHFAIPFNKKQRKGRTVRCRLPNYFDWQYNTIGKAKDLYLYETKPNCNKFDDWLVPNYIQKRLTL